MNRSRFTAMIKAITSAILITVCTVSCGNKTDDPVSPSPSANVTATPFGTPTAVPWINPTPTPDPNSTPTPTPAPTPTPTPTAAPTATPTPQPTAAPTSRPMQKTMRVPEFEYPFIHDALEAACTSSLPGLTAEFIGSCGVDYYLNTESNKNRIEKMNRISMNIHNGSNERIEFVSWIRQIDTYYLDPGEDGYFEYRLSSAMSLITPGTYTCEIPFRTSSGSEQKLTVEFSLSADGVEKIKNADYKVLFTGKPVIYLYPEKDTPVTVKLDYSGVLNCTYPKYEDGWTVLAHPDGTLEKDGKEYSYLFWDGYADIDYDMSRGWCVKGEDTADFLQEHLSAMGMTPREYNEFIVYWLPLMQNNEYNLITFQHEKYEENAKLDISPAPDSILRVFMVYKPLDGYVSIDAPDDEPTFTRSGFTVVEWGATCLD